MLEEHIQEDLTIDNPEDRLEVLKEKLQEAESLHDEMLELKRKRRELKDDIEALVDAEIEYNDDETFKGFGFHPFIFPYVTEEIKGKHASAVVEINDCDMVFQIQAQNVTDYQKVQSEVHASRELEESKTFPQNQARAEVLKDVEELFETKTRNRVQTRIVKKTR